MQHRRSLVWSILPLCLIAVALASAPFPTESFSDVSGIEVAWQRVLDLGAYDFTADVEQTLIPRPIPSMIGQTDTRVDLRLEGSVSLPDQTHLSLQIEGGGLDTPPVELVRDGAETYMLNGDERIPVENPLALSAPSGDFLTYLAAAENVQPCDPADLPSANSHTCYTYDINGARFAEHVRDQARAQYENSGQPLPPGVEFEPSSQLQRIEGRGQLWVGADGLPRRQVVDLEMPQVNREYDALVHVVMDLSYDEEQIALAGLTSAGWSADAALVLGDISTNLLLCLSSLAAILLLVRQRHQRWVHVLLVVGVSIAIVITFPLQAAATARFYEQRITSTTTIAEVLGLPTDVPQESPRLAPAEPLSRCGDGDPGADADNDGLSDADENCLGTDPQHEDTDRDLITDTLEIDGFNYAGVDWVSDPFMADSNSDGLPDYFEWPEPVGGAPQLSGAADDWDPDGDGVPNLWDDDNDGDEVPDGADLSPFARTSYSSTFSLATQGGGFDGYQYIEIQVQPEDISHLRYSTGYLDWPIDDLGQIMDLDDSAEDIRLYPMLRISTNQAPNRSLARDYGVSVVEEDDGYTLYVPVTPVGDGGQMVAFYSKVAYGPDELDDIRWERVELVWTIQLSMDRQVGDDVATSITTIGIQEEDSFRVTGLQITKSSDFESAIIGTPDTSDDRWLFNVLFGLSNTFLTHEEPDLQEIEHRFNSPNTEIEKTWGVPSERVVVDLPANPYGHTDEGVLDLPERTRDFLGEYYDPADGNPSLIFAYQETFGLYGLEDQGEFEPGSHMSLNLDNVAMSTRRGLKSHTYEYEEGAWQSLGLEDTLDVIEQRYEGELSAILDDLQQEGDYPDLTEEDLLSLLRMFYASWYVGEMRVISTDGQVYVDELRDDEEVYDQLSRERTALPAYILEATDIGDPEGGLRVGGDQTEAWEYLRGQEAAGNTSGFVPEWMGFVAEKILLNLARLRTAYKTITGVQAAIKAIAITGKWFKFAKIGWSWGIGLTLALGFVWFGFLGSASEAGWDPSSPAFRSALTYALVATVIYTIMFVMALCPAGTLLVGLLTFMDWIFLAVSLGELSFTGLIIKALADFIYSAHELTTFEDVDFVDFDTALMDEEIGVVVGNRFRITDECLGTIERASAGETEDLLDSYVTCLYQGSATDAAWANRNGGRTCTRSGGTLTCRDPVGVEFRLDTAARNVELEVESSVTARTFYEECWVGGAKCERESVYTHLPDDLPRYNRWDPMEFYLDVLPANFLDLWTWDEIINPDPDGDGLSDDEEDELGTDPDDWDSDGDGLSDGFEFDREEDLGTDPLLDDTDGDGLLDGHEYRIGTQINAADSDDDGLTDGDEVFHFDGSSWVGGWQVVLPTRTAQVFSDPQVSDADADGLNDRSERNGTTSPYGYNDAPALELEAEPLAESPNGAVAAYVDLGDTVAMTLTLENVSPNPVTDTLTLCMPSFLTNIQGGTMQGDRLPPKGSAGSCNGLEWSFAAPNSLLPNEAVSTTVSAQVSGLGASASGEISVTLPHLIGESVVNVVDQVAVVADLDDPDVSMVAPPGDILLGGGISNYVIGGSASDDDSWVTVVEVNLPGVGWVDAEGISPWAYTWDLPSDGVYSLYARSTDALGHSSLQATSVVTVDNTAPGVSISLDDGEVVSGESGDTITITLSGGATDNLSGLARVQISIDGRPWQEVWAGGGAPLAAAWNRDWILPNQESAQGEHTASVRALDLAGNESDVVQRTIIVDVLPPTSELTSRTYLNDPPPHVPSNQAIGLYGVANDAGNAPQPARPVELVGELDGLHDATIWLELNSVDDDDGGVSVTWLGDFNGDRLSDLAVGQPAAADGAGEIVIVYGRAGDWPAPTGAELLADSPTSLIGASGAGIGSSLAAVGDVDRDGFDDLLVGDSTNDRVYLVFGRPGPLGRSLVLDGPHSAYWSEITAPAGEQIGDWLGGAGDVNGDGFDDLLIGATGAEGKTYLLLGEPAAWWETVPLEVKAAAEIATSASGARPVGVGDMDGDEYDEFAIADGTTVYLFEGSASYTAEEGESLELDDAIATFTSADTLPEISALGDVDGDVHSLSDMVYSDGDTPQIVFGDINRDWDTQSVSLSPAASGFLAAPGDVDVDGLADILIGNVDGDVYLILGENTFEVAATLTGVETAASTRYAAGADLNGDGSSDLLLVSSESDAGTSGREYGPYSRVDPSDLPVAIAGLPVAQAASKPWVPRVAGMRYVNDDGSCEGGTPCYSEIQAAIDAAAVGDTIEVEPGVYDSFTISGTNDLTVSGIHADAVFVDGGGGAFAARIQNATSVRLEDMTLYNADEVVYLDHAGVGGHENAADRTELDTLLIYDFGSHAVAMDRSSSVRLKSCTLVGGDDHIEVYGAPDPAVDATWSTVSSDSRTATSVRGGILSDGDQVYFIDDSAQIDVYDPNASTWSSFSVPPEGFNSGMTADENGHLWALRGDELGGFDGPIYDVVYISDNEIYVGGDFHQVGDLALDYIARWDGNGWVTVGTGGSAPDGAVHAIAVDGVELYAGGPFGLRYLPDRTHASAWQNFGEIAGGGSVLAIAPEGGDVYVGGSFTDIGGISANRIAKRDDLGTWRLLGYAANSTCNGAMRGSHVSALVIKGNYLYIGGRFATVAYNPNNPNAYCGVGCSSNVAALRLYNDTFTRITSCDEMMSARESVFSLAFSGDDLVVGGDYSCVDHEVGSGWEACDRSADNLAILKPDYSWVIPTYLQTNGPVRSIQVDGSSLYIGGDFTRVGESTSVDRVAYYDSFPDTGGSWYSLDGGLNARVHALVRAAGDTYVGGDFTQAGDGAAFYFSRYDGSDWNQQRFYEYSGSWLARTGPQVRLGEGSAIADAGDGILYAVTGGSSSDFYRYTVSSDSWAERADLPDVLGAGGSLAWADGYLYALRGGGSGDFYRYDPAANSWSTLEPVTDSVTIGAGGGLAWDGVNWLYVLAGGNGRQFQRYRIPDARWEVLSDTVAAVNAGGGLARVGQNLYGAPGGDSELWSYDPIALYLEKLTLDQVAFVAPENTIAPNWINLNSVVIMPDDFTVVGNDNTWVGGSSATWGPDPQLDDSAEITYDEARFLDAEHDVYRVDAGSQLDGGYHSYRSDVVMTGGPEDYIVSIQAAINSGANRVYLRTGVFREPFYLVSGVEVIGNGADLTILEPRAGGTEAELVRGEGVVGAALSMLTLNGDGAGVDGLGLEDGARDTVVRRTIIRNTDTAISVAGSDTALEVVNNTVVSNTDGMIASSCAPVDVRNTIFVGHSGTGLTYDGCATRKLHGYNLYWDNSTDISPASPGPGELFLDPLFVDPNAPAYDYHTQDGSPVIDAGDPGDPPPPGAGGRVDIGYIEQNRAALYVDDDYCSTCINDGLSWQVDAFDSIQDALDTAADNIRALKGPRYTVGVGGGTYSETITIPSHVSLIGSGAEESIVVADSSATAVTFDGVVQSEISGFSVRAYPNTTAISVTGASNAITISRNIIETTNSSGSHASVHFAGRATGRVEFNTIIDHYSVGDDTGVLSSGAGTWVAVENNIVSGDLQSAYSGCDYFSYGHYYGLRTLDFGQIFNDYNLMRAPFVYQDDANTGLVQGPHDLRNVSPCFQYQTYRIEAASQARDAASPYADVPSGGGEQADMGYYELTAAPLPLFLGRADVSSAIGNSGVEAVEVGLSQVADPFSAVTTTLPGTWITITLDSPDETLSYWQTVFTPTQESLYRFYSRGTDVAGNREDEDAWYDGTFVADSVSPVVTWTLPSNGSSIETSPLQLWAEVYDYAAGEFSVDDIYFVVDGTEYPAEWAADPWDESAHEARTFRAWVDVGMGAHSGAYAVAVDRTGNVGQSSPVNFSVIGSTPADGTPPVLAVLLPVNGSWFTNTVVFSGTVLDAGTGVAAVEVSLDGGYTWAPATVDGIDWHMTWEADGDLEYVSYPVQVRARDQVGNTSTDTRSFSIDNQPPYGPTVEEFTAMLFLGAPPETHHDAPPGTHFDLPMWLEITWREPVDGSGLATSLIAVDQVSNTLPTVNVGSVTSYTHYLATPGDWYVHLAVEDLLGNQFIRHYGPWHVGTAADLATLFQDRVQTIVVDGEINLDAAAGMWSDFGWEWGLFELMDNFEPTQMVPDWWDPQNLLFTWDGDNLYLGYQGAYWDLDGGLWAYIGTESGGSAAPVVPMSNTLPFAADTALLVSSSDTISQWDWNGGSWQPVAFTGDFAQGDGGSTEIGLPMSLEAVASLELIVFALDETGDPWAIFPTTNPLTGAWPDYYAWNNLSTVFTTTQQWLIGSSAFMDLDSPQAPLGVWGPGDSIEYVVVINNQELFTLTNPALTFGVDPGVVYQSVAGAVLSDTWEFELGDLGPGATQVITVAATLSNDLCSLIGGDSVGINVTLDTLPPLQLSLSHLVDCEAPSVYLPSRREVACSQQAVYGTASDGFGSGVSLVEFRPVGSSEWQPANGTLFWAADIPLSVTDTWEIEVRAWDWYSHSSSVESGEFTVIQVTDLSLVKYVTPYNAFPGHSVVFTLDFGNDSRCMGRGVTIQDYMPISLTVTSIVSTGVAITDTGGVAPYAWQVQDLAPGERGVITITGVLDEALIDGQVLTNTATITATTMESDVDDNSDQAGLWVTIEELYLPLIFRSN